MSTTAHIENSKTERPANIQKTISNTQERFLFGQDKTVCKYLAHDILPLTKWPTDRTDDYRTKKHQWKCMNLFECKWIASSPHSNTFLDLDLDSPLWCWLRVDLTVPRYLILLASVLFSNFISATICNFVKGNICRKFPPKSVVLVQIKSIHV